MTKEEFTAKWNHMLQLQRKLDERIIQGNGLTYENILDAEGYRYALLDELGELNHELKKNWCWWKKSQKDVNHDRVLEEFVDMLHFVLSWSLADDEYTPHQDWRQCSSDAAWNSYANQPYNAKLNTYQMADYIANSDWSPINELIQLMKGIGLDFNEVYEAYIAKNTENHERQDRGY